MARVVATTVEYSLTETAQFRRLVEFLHAVNDHAEEGDDYELRAIVREVVEDLMRLSGS